MDGTRLVLGCQYEFHTATDKRHVYAHLVDVEKISAAGFAMVEAAARPRRNTLLMRSENAMMKIQTHTIYRNLGGVFT